MPPAVNQTRRRYHRYLYRPSRTVSPRRQRYHGEFDPEKIAEILDTDELLVAVNGLPIEITVGDK
jgi:hypothetical protein